jgi:hypothetical protein
MIAIVAHTDKSLKKYEEVFKDLQDKLKDRGYSLNISQCADDVMVRHGYANTEYRGTLSPDLDALTDLQVAMLCDGGYSWFGGECRKTGLNFYVKVYTD